MLPLTELDDAYEDVLSMPGRSVPAADAGDSRHRPEVPDHQKRTRPVSIRPDVHDFQVLDPGVGVPKRKRAAAASDAPGTSFNDRMWMRRKDMTSVAVMVLIVTAGLALHAALSDMLGAYIDTAYMTPWWERATRLSYPAGAVAAIWCLKSSK
jgi:hypothetical protein